MKAISPALPMTTPSRHTSDADASPADEAFGALIAAVIGASPTPSTPTPSSSRPSMSRVDRSDDARPAAANHGPTRIDKADAGSAADPTDDTGSAERADKSDTAGQSASAGNTGASDHVAKDAAAAKAPSATTPATPAVPTKIPAGLEKAASALAQALSTSAGGSAKAAATKAVHPGVPASVGAAKPGSALTEGQLPAQLVAAATAAHAGSGLAAVGAPTKSDAGQPAATPLVGQPETPAPPAVAGQPVTDPSKAPGTQAVLSATTPTTRPQASSDLVVNMATASTSPPMTPPTKPTNGQHGGTNDIVVGPASHDATAAQPALPLVPQPAPMTTPAPTVAAAPAQPAYTSGLVSQQIVQVVAPLRTAKDGDYTLSLQLHPAELGPVTVRVDVQQGVLSVHLTADHSHGHDALNQSLTDLRSQLQSNGVRTGDIVVAAKPSLTPQQHHDQQQHAGGNHRQEAPMRDHAGTDRRPSDRASRHTPTQADDDTLDVRI